MSIRKVTKLDNDAICEPIYITKKVDIDRRIPFCYDKKDLEAIKDQLSDKEYIALYQQFTEIEMFNKSDWQERELLAPIIDVYYDSNNCPVLIFPFFIPLATEEEAKLIEDDAVVEILLNKVELLGFNEYQLGLFLDKLSDFCYSNDLYEKEVLLNINNIGYNKYFGVRVLNYGMTNSAYKELKNKYAG